MRSEWQPHYICVSSGLLIHIATVKEVSPEHRLMHHIWPRAHEVVDIRWRLERRREHGEPPGGHPLLALRVPWLNGDAS